MQDLDLSIALYDQRGHGNSEGTQVFVEYFDQFTEDFTAFLSFMRSNYVLPRKIYVLGHSLGGLIATRWCLKNQDAVRALFLSSPCFGINIPNWLIKFNNAVNVFFPKLEYKNPIYPPHLTHDAEEMAAYKKDPLIRRKITSRLLNQMTETMDEVRTSKVNELSFPLFVLMAGLEKVVDKACVLEFYNKVSSDHKECKEFEGYYHEIFQEKGKEEVFKVLKSYLVKTAAITSAN